MEPGVHSFIVRIWHETVEGTQKLQWRGYIDHVGGYQRLYFSDLKGIIRFIRQEIGIEDAHRYTLLKKWLVHLRDEIHGLWEKPLY